MLSSSKALKAQNKKVSLGISQAFGEVLQNEKEESEINLNLFENNPN